MKRQNIASLCSAVLLATASLSQATLTGFTDYALGGLTASWDIFYGGNYLPVFNFATGTAGNPILNSTGNLTLTASITSWIAGPPTPSRKQATGPLDSDGSTPGGDRELFYTFFSDSAAWNITANAEGELETFVFQVQVDDGSNTGLSNVLLNGAAASSSSFDMDTDVGTWTWTGLDISAGEQYSLAWNTGTHAAFDSLQIQTSAVPEPSAVLLVAAAGLSLRALRRRRSV